jgi:hypothetical protein
VGGGFENFPVDCGCGADEEGVGVFDGVDEFGPVGAVNPPYFYLVPEGIDGGLREFVRDEDYRFAVVAHVEISWIILGMVVVIGVWSPPGAACDLPIV